VSPVESAPTRVAFEPARGQVGCEAFHQFTVPSGIADNAIGKSCLPCALDPDAVAIAIEIEAAGHGEMLFREGQCLAPAELMLFA
jgi:hypothetical protein